MRILFITTRISDGVFAVRGSLPIKWLKKRGHEVDILEENGAYTGEEIIKKIIWADVIQFSRSYNTNEDFIKHILEYCVENGKRVAYDTDDLLINVFQHHPNYKDIKPLVPQVRMLAGFADVVTVTGEPLREAYSRFNKNVKILPNCIDPAEWKLRKGGNKRLKIGWTGTLTHIADLLLVVDVIAELKRTYEFEFVLFGLTSEKWEDFKDNLKKDYEKHSAWNQYARKQEWYEKFEELDRALSKFEWTHIPFVPIEKYKETLSEMNFDIGLCPLENNHFNSCKSAIKFYEYAMVGTVTIASNVLPYKGEVNYANKNRYDKWLGHLRTLIESEEIRNDVLVRQREWVIKNRNIADKVALWEEAYE